MKASRTGSMARKARFQAPSSSAANTLPAASKVRMFRATPSSSARALEGHRYALKFTVGATLGEDRVAKVDGGGEDAAGGQFGQNGWGD